MVSLSPSCYFQDGGLRRMVSMNGVIAKNLKIPLSASFPLSTSKYKFVTGIPPKKVPLLPHIKCEKKDNEKPYKEISVERPPYHSYMDSTSGRLEPASGARASIPGQDYWPEGTSSRVRAARAPEPAGESTGKPSFGKKPGSRRKKYKAAASASDSPEINAVVGDHAEDESQYDSLDERIELSSSEYVVYETKYEEGELEGYALDKKIGNPHPFIDPKVKKTIDGTLTSEELWWNWRKPEKEQWSRWQRRRPDVETVFLKAMAETGQVKLYGEEPTLTECALYRARRHLYKEERLEAERKRLHEIGPIAYYSEWVSAWKRDTSKEAVQKHFEETGEDENTQLIEMFMHQTDREFRIMMGTDVRIKRDPLAMRMREDQIKQIWGGDPVYPTINYIQDPNEVIDYRGPDFHEPTPNMLDYLKEHGKIITREELDQILGKEKIEEVEQTSDMDDAMARAVDIGENDDEGEESEVEGDGEEDQKATSNWSLLKSNPVEKRKAKPKKDSMSLGEAIDDSENLTDFLLDFDTEE